ncbi:MAG: cupin domain-containing protein [Planctomycetota bacterium]|nr:cupin domain-containing protein [Planctomycetota bacterium]
MPVKLLKIDQARTVKLHDGFLESWFFDQDTPTDSGVMAMATIEPEVCCGLHMHSAEEFFYIVRGQDCSWTGLFVDKIVRGQGIGEIGGREVTLEAGLAMYVPANIAHNFTNTGDSNLEILYFMSAQDYTTTQL